MTKKKILFVLHIPPPTHGSSIVGKQIITSKLINTNFDIEYVNLGTSYRISDIGGWSFSKTIIFLKLITLIFKKLLTKKFDLIYMAPTVSHSGFYKDFFVSSILKFFNKNIVFHLHNKGILNRKRNILNNYLYKVFFSGTNVIILSKLLYKDIFEFVDENRISICPNGIEFIPNLHKSLVNKLYKEPVILFLSNMIESKGVLVLLKSCKILNEKGIEFKCLFVGGEGDIKEADFNDKVKLFNLSNKVFYLGKKYGLDKHNIFLSADIFAFPTFYDNECFPLVNIEAMQYSLPIVTSNEGGIPDMVKDGHTGYIVSKNNPNELSKKLLLLIENRELREQLGNNGRKMFLENYRLETFEKQLKTILNELL